MSTREIRYIYLAISPYIGSIGAYSVLPVTLQSCRHLCGTIYFTWCLQDSIVMYLVSRGVTDYRDCGQHVRELALDLEHCIEEWRDLQRGCVICMTHDVEISDLVRCPEVCPPDVQLLDLLPQLLLDGQLVVLQEDFLNVRLFCEAWPNCKAPKKGLRIVKDPLL